MWEYFFQLTLSKGRRSGCQLAHQAAATLPFLERVGLRPMSISVEPVTESPRADAFPARTSSGKTTVQSATKRTMVAERKSREAESKHQPVLTNAKEARVSFFRIEPQGLTCGPGVSWQPKCAYVTRTRWGGLPHLVTPPKGEDCRRHGLEEEVGVRELQGKGRPLTT